MDKKDLKTRVLLFRSRHNMSQARLAEECGVHPLTIMKVEKGGRIRPTTAIKIADFLERNNG